MLYFSICINKENFDKTKKVLYKKMQIMKKSVISEVYKV